MSTGKKKLSRSFQNWLLLLVIAAFLTTTAFLWIIQTKLAMENTVRLLELNILDVRSDIKDASDENLLELTEQIAREVNGAETVTGDFLTQLSDRYDVTDINCVDREGIIYATTFPEFLNYNIQVYVGPMDKMHSLFEIDNIHECNGLDGVGPFNLHRLYFLYREIKKYL